MCILLQGVRVAVSEHREALRNHDWHVADDDAVLLNNVVTAGVAHIDLGRGFMVKMARMEVAMVVMVVVGAL